MPIAERRVTQITRILNVLARSEVPMSGPQIALAADIHLPSCYSTLSKMYRQGQVERVLEGWIFPRHVSPPVPSPPPPVPILRLVEPHREVETSAFPVIQSHSIGLDLDELEAAERALSALDLWQRRHVVERIIAPALALLDQPGGLRVVR